VRGYFPAQGAGGGAREKHAAIASQADHYFLVELRILHRSRHQTRFVLDAQM
jgi:hypothetical protein